MDSLASSMHANLTDDERKEHNLQDDCLTSRSSVNALRSKFMRIINNNQKQMRLRSQSVPCEERQLPTHQNSRIGSKADEDAHGLIGPSDPSVSDRFRQAQELFKRLESFSVSSADESHFIATVTANSVDLHAFSEAQNDETAVDRANTTDCSEIIRESDFVQLLSNKNGRQDRDSDTKHSAELFISDEEHTTQEECQRTEAQVENCAAALEGNLQDSGRKESTVRSNNENKSVIRSSRKTVSFSSMPTQIYETYSSVDYDRRNENIDPMAASAEYELEKRIEKMDLYTVQLRKDGTHCDLGITPIGIGIGADAGIERLGMFIKCVSTPNIISSSDEKTLEVGDQIVEINGVSLVGVTQNFANSFLKQTEGDIMLLMGRERDRSDSEIIRLIRESIEVEKGEWTRQQTQTISSDSRTALMMQDDDSSLNTEEQSVLRSSQADAVIEKQSLRITELEKEIVILNREIAGLENVKKRNIVLEQHVEECERKLSDMDNLLNIRIREKKDLEAQIVFYRHQCSDLESKYLRASEALLSNLRRRERVDNEAKSLIAAQNASYYIDDYSRAAPPSVTSSHNARAPPWNVLTGVDRRVDDYVSRYIRTGDNSFSNRDIDDESSQNEDHSFPLTLDEGWAELDEEGDIVNTVGPFSNEDASSLPSAVNIACGGSVRGHWKSESNESSTAAGASPANSSKIQSTKSGLGEESSELEIRPNSAPPDGRIRHSRKNIPIAQWNVEDVAAWLKSHNLTNHVNLFRSLRIDGAQLSRLDGGKLKSMGIRSRRERDYLKSRLKHLFKTYEEAHPSFHSTTFKLSDAFFFVRRPSRRRL